MPRSDPTDHALAAIASILDRPVPQREPGTAKAAGKSTAAPASDDVDGYSKSGPGPIAALRFKWTVRRSDEGEYFVDESLGTSTAPVAIGPLDREAAVKLVDECEREAQSRFEQLKSEIIGRTTVADLVRKSDET
ncbi:MAG: hypothetical protein JOY90_08035 [Bradyrhizobium sp.]|uniref:hypothetical protein n=1 Tax=Bradyrhizobium sp. TaxID=376 RepID=UPI001D60C871|nr:hypothetical protein [Bradyrhizobium sp.]MBV9560394.1 hypothetical protein [Bradyrhizobium sp.]